MFNLHYDANDSSPPTNLKKKQKKKQLAKS